MTQTLTAYVAGELRAEMARQDVSATELAGRLGVSDVWVGRRVKGKTAMTIEDLERCATALGVSFYQFLPERRVVAA